MCGRFSQARSWSELVALYGITVASPPLNLPPRYNIAPTDRIPIIRRPSGGSGRELVLARWGLIPAWAKDEKIAAQTINARAETVDVKPAFRSAFRHRRCLIAADGFYEWQATAAGKQPYFITRAGDAPFAFAGLWERWQGSDGTPIDSATIIVTDANAALAPIHGRMPVMLEPEEFATWLDPATPLAAAKAMLRPYGGALTIYPVSRRVNSVRNDDPDCRAPLPRVPADGGRS